MGGNINPFHPFRTVWSLSHPLGLPGFASLGLLVELCSAGRLGCFVLFERIPDLFDGLRIMFERFPGFFDGLRVIVISYYF